MHEQNIARHGVHPSGTSNDEKIKLITSAIGYSKGPLTLSLGYDRLHSSAWAKNVHSWVAVAGYELKSVSLGAAVGQDINGRQSSLSSYLSNPAFATWGSGYVPDFKTTGLTFNATVPVGTAASVMVGWSGSRASSGFHNAYNLDKRQQNIYSAGYTYNLSKRTSFYVKQPMQRVLLSRTSPHSKCLQAWTIVSKHCSATSFQSISGAGTWQVPTQMDFLVGTLSS